MPHTQTVAKKERLTVSLNRDSANFLRKYRAKEHLSSLSALVEWLVANWRRRLEMQEIEAKTVAYYDSLTAEERQEQLAWAEFSESEMARSEP